MQLPEEDEIFLNERGFAWSLSADGDQAGFLLIEDFDVSGGGFTPSVTTLMIRIPGQYNLAQLDMWYCDPHITVGATGQFPPSADVMETYLGRTWQRFSRHLNPGSWRPGVDGLRTFMPLIYRELKGQG